MRKIRLLILVLLITPSIVFAQNKKVDVTFSKCVDGDTAKFILNEEEITVRFLAIDTPETKHPTKGEEPYGKEASDFTCKSIQNASSIILEYDDNSNTYDKYNRHLVWVYVDDVLLQDELIKKGLAKVAYLYGDYAYTEQLQASEKIAQKQQIGIWSDEKPTAKSTLKDYWLLIVLAIAIIIVYIFSTKGRKKINRKIKSKVKSEMKKEVKDEFKKWIS